MISKRFNATLPEVLRQWSVVEVFTALELLDVLEEAEAKAYYNARSGV